MLLDPTKAEFRSTHLKTVSTLRLHKLATIHSSGLARYLGALDSATFATVASKLKQLLAL
jgi:mRNA-degrading endonuclease toxin of MazEF toxin-antitoxin module